MGTPSKLRVRALRVQNLRNFTDASIRLDQPVHFLVGPNNAGKTSLLRLLDVVFNWSLKAEFRHPTDALLEQLLPRRETRNAARRLTIWIEVDDKRRHSRFACGSDGIAQLRLSLTLRDRRLRANLGRPRRNEAHEEDAEQLLDELRRSYAFTHIPAGRSADSDEFATTLQSSMVELLSSTLKQPGRGASKAERDAKKVLERLGDLAGPLEEYWGELRGRLPSGWALSGSAEPLLDHHVLATFVVNQLHVAISGPTR